MFGMSEIGESLPERIERLSLEEFVEGDIVHITTGTDEKAFRYRFSVEEASRWPKGQLEETRPDGTVVGPFPVLIHGSGRWTTREQNPVQTQDRALSSYFDSIRCGDFLIAAHPDAKPGDRMIFDKPGQEISEITIERPTV